MNSLKPNLLVMMVVSVIRISETAVVSSRQVYSPTTWGGGMYPVAYGASERTPYSMTEQDQQMSLPTPKTKYVNRYQILQPNVPSYSLYVQPTMNRDLKQPGYLVGQQSLPGQATTVYSRDQQIQAATANAGTDDEVEITPRTTARDSQYSDSSVVGSPDDGVIGNNGGILGSPQDLAVVESAGQPVYTGDMRQNQYLYSNTVPLDRRLYNPSFNSLQYQFDKHMNTMQFGMNQYEQPLYGQVSTGTIPSSQYANGLTATNM
ncbi:hypothetical protein MN116_001414 [Schistosoma mekongi]|uniref:Uncharacterized protein n=1 Tax=Schistosoma mekongi TaxID=38744 RepID=A0AAE2D9L7_SCHME|nr:hypothetical protein MN116_001414 [Schistosoma mekongi]